MILKDADALKDKLCEHCDAPHIRNCTIDECRDMLCSAMDAIDKAPTIDAVEVVRCENCLYWNKENEMCNAFDAVTPYDGYCYFGMLREVEDGTD